MAGTNPYIDPPEVTLPQSSYQIIFKSPEGQEVKVTVDPAKIPYSGTGLDGSLLDIALEHDVDLDHACGGVCACSTCHVVVSQGLDSCNESTDPEEDMLDNAPGLTPESRLACQCVPDGTQDVVVEIPAWNRNSARE